MIRELSSIVSVKQWKANIFPPFSSLLSSSLSCKAKILQKEFTLPLKINQICVNTTFTLGEDSIQLSQKESILYLFFLFSTSPFKWSIFHSVFYCPWRTGCAAAEGEGGSRGYLCINHFCINTICQKCTKACCAMVSSHEQPLKHWILGIYFELIPCICLKGLPYQFKFKPTCIFLW